VLICTWRVPIYERDAGVLGDIAECDRWGAFALPGLLRTNHRRKDKHRRRQGKESRPDATADFWFAGRRRHTGIVLRPASCTMWRRNQGLLLTRQSLVLVLSLTASLSAARTSAQALKLSLEAYPAEIRSDLARPYENVRAHPDDPNAVGALARVLQAWEQWETAHEVYTRAISLAPTSFEWHYLDACVLDRLARPQDAVVHLREALKIRPEYIAARVRLADALLSA